MAILDTKNKEKANEDSDNANKNDDSGGSSQKKKANVEYNPRWDGYSAIGFLSLIEYASVANVVNSLQFNGSPGIALAWGLVSSIVAGVIIAFDRSQCFIDKFNYTKALDGRFEGYTLLSFIAYWIVGVGFITQVDGIGYSTLNIYFSTWLTLFACVYTLNEWSTAKDILSIHELTGLSATLKSWWVLFLSSLVVFGTSINYIAFFEQAGTGVISGAVIGIFSAIMSAIWICVHYKFIEFMTQGGWIELSCGLCCTIMWIVSVTLITQDGGVGTSIVGTGCPGNIYTKYSEEAINENCTVVIEVEGGDNAKSSTCIDLLVLEIPGSNLFVFTWISLASAVNVCFRWKAQQALQFAQARNTNLQQKAAAEKSQQAGSGGVEDNDENDDDDLDEFEDAAY